MKRRIRELLENSCNPKSEEPAVEELALERHYTPDEIAKLWTISSATVRRLFLKEPGVVILSVDVCPGRRPYRTMRVPQSVLTRVYERLCVRP